MTRKYLKHNTTSSTHPQAFGEANVSQPELRQSDFPSRNGGPGNVAAQANTDCVFTGPVLTQIEDGSEVLNGNVYDVQKPQPQGWNVMQGGFVKGNSKLVNGNMPKEAFLAYFCAKKKTP
ncbi:uncharacterized protein N7496_006086 [Penicillium cataractarum]|uniref:Uncharacterized protein n=1 Tax=Penicillium cataractarum TaxID=2100454 RepID=A0A9W9S3L2_9EURO|nr:uncharacterized protein N7496_006086 [Penicillium cataractarum]KAJ5369994.1 hypothetical protein N7496_006086 [Penicillium cataractarum]